MIVLKQKFIYREDLKNNEHVLYLFGDNLYRYGLGGQAKEMRGEANSFGIATKRRPSHGDVVDYFHDHEDDAPKIIQDEFERLHTVIKKARHGVFPYTALVIPSDGIGTGLSRLPEFAPKLLELINKNLERLRYL